METPRASPSDAGESSAVQVAVRVRPLSASESAQGSEPCVSVLGDVAVLVGGLSGKQFDFDAVFPARVEQQNVYDALVAPLVDRFFDGYNATVFAYGQTGSGKTFTMGNEFKLSAAPADRGIIPRTMDEIFTRIAAAPANVKYALRVSYLEILNEEIHDLLTSSPSHTSLSVRDDGKRGICVNGLSEHAVESLEQVATLLHTGALSRATASTTMNAQSSRSHAICTLTMEQFEATAERGAEAKFSKFHLVDLAGSERAKRTNAEGARFKEGVNINKGLLALGNVINALAEKSTHVPYRDSKLTRLLQDSLGGNSKTLMIACISPADLNFEETCNTLRYAARARNIQNQAVVNQTLSVESQVTYLKQQLEVVQLQLLQQQQGKTSSSQPMAGISVPSFEILEKEITRWKTIAKTREEELQLVMSAKNKWKKIADEFSTKKQRGPQLGAGRVHAANGDIHSPKSKAMLQDAIEFDKSVQVTQFPSSPAKLSDAENTGYTDVIDSDNAWENDVDSLEDVIKEKEKIVQALSAAGAGDHPSNGDTHGLLTALSKGYEQKIRELELQVTKLVEEKKRFARDVKGKGDTSSGESAHGRLHAQLQLVQNQLQVARQAEKECKRLSLLWKNGTLKISTLEKEIVDMKKQKATLQRQLKDESESHRKEKREQNLKIIQLKRQEQRKQYELQKLTTLHAKQNNVLKRKNEEIALVNKRMKSLVQTQQSAQQMRLQSAKNRAPIMGARPGGVGNATLDKSVDSSDGDAMASVLQALKETLSVHRTITGAKSAIQMELEDRRRMALEISRVENCGDAESSTSSKLDELKAALKEKNADIRLLQQKLVSVEKNSTLPDALFPTKVILCHKLIRQLMETIFASATATLELENCKSDLEAAEEQLSEQSQRHDEVVTAYKKQLHRLGHFDEVTVDMSTNASNAELERLKNELKEVRAQLEHARSQPAIPTGSTAAARKKAPVKKKPTVDLVDSMSSSSEDEDEDEEDDDSDYIEDEDASARKRKAVGSKARQPLQPRVEELKPASAMDEIDMLLSKPSVVGGTVCCSCSGKCATKSCACRAEKGLCGADCSCKASRCLNRGGDVDSSKLGAKKRRSDPLQSNKENEVESFFYVADKENLPPPSLNQCDKENAPPPPAAPSTTKFKKLWSGNRTSNNIKPSSSTLFSKNSSLSSNNRNSSAIARFF